MKRLLLLIMTSLFALVLGHASAAEVTVGPGDVLKVSVYGNPDLTTETRVSPSGNITMPLIGEVYLQNLSVAAAERKIAGLLEAGSYVKRPQVNILVTMVQSQLVSVLGQVLRPGRYPIDSRNSVLDMLAMAGGVGPEGGDTVALIRKRDGTTTKEVINLLDLVRNVDLSRNVEVAANDVIYVERAPRIYIYGEVQRPGAIRLEREMTVLQALSAGGGLTPRGTERGIRIKRRDANGQLQVLDAKHDDLLQNDDVVYVKESWF